MLEKPDGTSISLRLNLFLMATTGPELILQKQFRPPVNKITIEVPAGLIDAGETPEQAAVRELKEETGYVGVVSDSTPLMFNGSYSSIPPLASQQVLPPPALFLTFHRSRLLQHQHEDGACDH